MFVISTKLRLPIQHNPLSESPAMMPNLGEPSPPNSNSAEPLVSKSVITKSPMMSDSSVCDQNGVEPPVVAVEVDHENVEYDPNHPGCGSSSNITLLESNVTPDTGWDRMS